ncbi:MAG: cytochrome c biogenesis protein CcsA [Proteobacteria bacterium]|nr:cytochrome c biogenesis protein CcsA [Pseudomonadota bacterium]
MTLLGHGLAAALYLFAAVSGWRPDAEGLARRWVPRVIALGVGVHGLGLYGMHLESPPVPLESLAAALSLMGWLVAVAYIGALAFAQVRTGATWAAGLAALLTLLALLGLQNQAAVAAGGEAGLWSHAHVLLSAAGFSFLALASLAGAGYLVKGRALKRKDSASRSPELPSLESLDRAVHVTLGFGFVLLTLGVVSGFAWSLGREVDPWTRHSAFLLAAWCVYLVPVGLRMVSGVHGVRPARGVVLGFVFLAFAYIGIRMLGSVA